MVGRRDLLERHERILLALALRGLMAQSHVGCGGASGYGKLRIHERILDARERR
jgi:hypothetical protein